jgi:hypothetical protein
MRWMRALLLLLLLGPRDGAAADGRAPRWFADRPVAWLEHDDSDVAAPPRPTELQEWDGTLLLRDSLAGEIERVLSLEEQRPALDVNAIDEVPCSTWFCPRNHLRPMSAAEVAAGPPVAPPRLPLRIVKGKEDGASPGFQVLDADQRRFMLKLDPKDHLGLTTGAEVVGNRIFHAAGYNVPNAFPVDLGPQDLVLDPEATYRLYRVQKRPLPAQRVQAILATAARDPAGRVRGVAVPWIPGQILGGFDMQGRRADDPNDRIPHQHRRSLRASWVLFAWLQVLDPSSINSLDSYVEEGGRRFVRHYFIDFGCAFGSATVGVKGPHQGGEHLIEVGRTLAALTSLGLYRRPFQDRRTEWERTVAAYPEVGWFVADGFDPDLYRSNRKVPSHVRRTDRDLYWGAKLVTSFTDQQIAAAVAQARFPGAAAAYVEHGLRVRRDIIGRRYLRAMTAVEAPVVGADGGSVCFQDLAIARGYAAAGEVRYSALVNDGRGTRLLAERRQAAGPRTCLPIAARPTGTGYRIIEVTARLDGGAGIASRDEAKATRIHLRWRSREQRFVVVGLERDE